MCGLCGFWTPRSDVNRDAENVLASMSGEIIHRGPDASGEWVDRDHGVGFGHRRLAIIDLSPRGAQPMLSPDGRFAIAYNGEVYNFAALRDELGGTWRGDSDTEVVLAAIERWGVVEAAKRFVGMFAFAVFDRQTAELHLVRDRLGIKPMYYGRSDDTLLFGSQLRPFRRFPGFEWSIDRAALSAYLRYNCVPGELCILERFRKLEPGCVATFASRDVDPTIHRYWDARSERHARANTFEGSPDDAVDALRATLTQAVTDRMISDVPLGAFLSGGVDSSTVVALMQASTTTPVRTFSIGFEEDAYDEARHARDVAAALGTDHTELYVRPDDGLEVIPKLAAMYDEPFADSSQIPTHLVAQLARDHVTVALSGDGGDELFAGYNRHVWAPRVMTAMDRVPSLVRSTAARAVSAVDTKLWERAFDLLPGPELVRLPAEKLQKLAAVLPARTSGELYQTLRTHWREPQALVVGGSAGVRRFDELQDADFAQNMMFWDLTTYLPDDILTKVDRATMAVSLEARVPILDHRVVELAWSFPQDVKLRDGTAKWVLREVLYRHVQRELIERPKMGFGVPIDAWLRGPLKEWAAELLSPKRLVEDGILRTLPIDVAWDEHQSGRRNRHHELWDVLMFQAWLEDWKNPVVQG